MMRTPCLLMALMLVLAAPPSNANQETDSAMFERLFQNWTNAFNRKDLAGTCNFFSKDVVADYRGVPHKNYKSICDSFKKTFAENDRRYKYRFKLHEIYRSGNLAAVRVTWYLSISKDGKPISETTDQGLDVFRKEKDGTWRIVNYLGYEQ
jgi:uncharacterized protein (TIGR02246 family)